MLNIIKKCIILLIFVMLISISSCQISLAVEESTVSVTPKMITASSGDIFSIDILVDPLGNEIFGAQYELQFDNNLLKATEQTGGTFLSHDGIETIEVFNNINNSIGNIKYCETRIGEPQEVGSVTDSGILASITFEVIGTGTSELKLNALLADSDAQPINSTVSDGICNVEGSAHSSAVEETTEKQENYGSPGFGVVCSIMGFVASLLLIHKKLFK